MSRGPRSAKRGKLLKWGKKAANHGRKGSQGKRKKFRTFDQVKKQK